MKIIPSPCSPLSPVLADSVIARITNSNSESWITISNFALGRRSKAIGCPLHYRWCSLCLLHPETVEIVMPSIPICRRCSFTTGIRSDLTITSIFLIAVLFVRKFLKWVMACTEFDNKQTA